ncbi:amidohydrolase family protein, partial [Rhizobium ruizarguesonis]
GPHPQRRLTVETIGTRMWTEKVKWFSNEEGKKGRIEKGQFADLIVQDKDFLGCAEDEISFLTSEITMVGGKIVYAADNFA